MTINGRGYDVVDIANWFHSLPHLGRDLKPISNTTFDPQSEQYVTSVAIYIGLPIAVMVVILILYLLMTIIMCCCCTDGQKRKSIRIECKVFLFIFGLICGLSFISGLYGDWQMYQGIKSIQNSSQHAVNWLGDIKHNSTGVLNALNVDIVINNLKINIDELRKTLPSDDLKEYSEDCEQILSQIRSSKTQVLEANKTLNDVNYDDVPKYVDKYGTLFCIIAVTVLSVLAIVGIVFTVAICSRCVLGCFTVLAVIAFILCSLLAGTSFGVSVFGSDFCLDDKHWMKVMIGNNDVNDYLIDCIANNKVSQFMTMAQLYVENAKTTQTKLNLLKDYLNNSCQMGGTNLCPEDTVKQIKLYLNSLDQNIQQISDLVKKFTTLSKCNNINDQLDNTLDSICTDFLKGVVMVFFNTVASSFCFAMIVFSATFALR